METYNGHVRTPQDAIILFEACRMGILPRVQRRLSEKERQSIRSGSVFVWDEREAGMRRWTDGKSWSASRVSGSFLTYREMEGKRGGGGNFAHAARPESTPETPRNGDGQPQEEASEEGPDGYRYKPDGLVKQSFSITTSQGQHLHLISYFARSHPTPPGLLQPSNDPALRNIRPQKGMYPESSVNEQSTVPAVTRSPMPGAPNYAMAPQSPVYAPRPGATHPQGYMPPVYAPPAYPYPPNGMHPPPPGPAPPMQYYPPGPGGLPPMGYAPAYGPPQPQPQPQPQPHPHPHPQHHMNQPPPTAYDSRPARAPDANHGPLPPHSGHLANVSMPTSHNRSHGYMPAPPTHPTPSPRPSRDSPQQQAAAALQIDPRLMGAAAPAAPATRANGPSMAPLDGEQAAAEHSVHGHGHGHGHAGATSQPPTLTSMMHGRKTASDEARDGDEQKENDTSPTSPGGTKQNGAVQDIPSEKLAFREDKRALRQLDKVFAA